MVFTPLQPAPDRAGVTRDTILQLARRLTSTESGLLTSVQELSMGVPRADRGGVHKWGFPQMGVPKNGWFIRKTSHLEMDDLEVPLFQETSKWS